MSDAASDTFKALKRKARSVRARPRKAKAKRGAGGVPQAAVAEVPMLSDASQNIPQKALAPLPPPPQPAPQPATPFTDIPAADISPESHWRQMGHVDVLVYCRPINPRLLLIRTDSGENGRVPVRPDMQPRFGVGKRIWVKPTTKPGFYELVGTYTQWGKRTH